MQQLGWTLTTALCSVFKSEAEKVTYYMIPFNTLEEDNIVELEKRSVAIDCQVTGQGWEVGSIRGPVSDDGKILCVDCGGITKLCTWDKIAEKCMHTHILTKEGKEKKS